MGNVNFCKQAKLFYKPGVGEKKLMVLNDVSNCKPMIIIQNAYSLTEIH